MYAWFAVSQDFLISEVTLENCVDIGHIANAYNLSRVDHHVNVFMLQNFNLVNDFNKVPYERLRFLMSSNNLKVLNTVNSGQSGTPRCPDGLTPRYPAIATFIFQSFGLFVYYIRTG